MKILKQKPIQLSELLNYLAENQAEESKIPSLHELSNELNLSVASLREQLAVARALGVIEARPRTGLRKIKYSFTPAIRESVSYAITMEPSHFEMYADLRRHLESSYWLQAVRFLTREDIEKMETLIKQAFDKLNGRPIQIPHREHRKLHMLMFSPIKNVFVSGVLEAYWDFYEAVGLDRYTEYSYLIGVWNHHQSIVESIKKGNFEEGHQKMSEHMELINKRNRQNE